VSAKSKDSETIAKSARRSPAEYLTPIVTRSRTEEVLDALVAMIEAADLKIGDKIPTEMELCDQLGVGRTTIREALIRWEGLGLVRRRRGAGTFLTANIRASKGLIPTKTKLEGEGLLRLVDVRRTLEIESVQRAARNATGPQKEIIAEAYKKIIKLVKKNRPWLGADREFHDAIHVASGNPLYGQILTDLDEAFHASKFKGSPFESPEFGHRSVKLHAELCDAIIDGDPKRAKTAICEILEKVEEEIREISDAD
jgi:GntR family transcriptional repressor for pyruvate dehydrogenase complex